MLVLGSIVFLGIVVAVATIYGSYRVFGHPLSVWSMKGCLYLWVPVVVALLVAVTPVATLTVRGYQATSELDKIVLEFIENNEVDRVLSAEKGEAWLFSFQKGGDVGTMLKIGEQYLMLQPVSDQQAEAP